MNRGGTINVSGHSVSKRSNSIVFGIIVLLCVTLFQNGVFIGDLFSSLPSTENLPTLEIQNNSEWHPGDVNNLIHDNQIPLKELFDNHSIVDDSQNLENIGDDANAYTISHIVNEVPYLTMYGAHRAEESFKLLPKWLQDYFEWQMLQ